MFTLEVGNQLLFSPLAQPKKKEKEKLKLKSDETYVTSAEKRITAA